jgi:hypothetical protein
LAGAERVADLGPAARRASHAARAARRVVVGTCAALAVSVRVAAAIARPGAACAGATARIRLTRPRASLTGRAAEAAGRADIATLAGSGGVTAAIAVRRRAVAARATGRDDSHDETERETRGQPTNDFHDFTCRRAGTGPPPKRGGYLPDAHL